jgi:hypothetical protein
LLGATPLATYHAAVMAVQLFENDACVFHLATVSDYPDFLCRADAFLNDLDNRLQRISKAVPACLYRQEFKIKRLCFLFRSRVNE